MSTPIEDDVRRIIATEMDLDPARITREDAQQLEIPSLDAIEIIFKLEAFISPPDRDPNSTPIRWAASSRRWAQALAAKAAAATPGDAARGAW